MTRWDLKWKQVMCSTGFILIFSTRQIMELENSVPIDYFPRMCNRNFKIYIPRYNKNNNVNNAVIIINNHIIC